MSDFKQSSELLVQQTQNTEMGGGGGGLFMVTPFSHFDSFECFFIGLFHFCLFLMFSIH